ncbi:ABC transporter substrate-binding protein [Streptomyces harbinensis]|uniref:ABC transporter substrate-binding protein n=1 Tax=Streptomyces harbinensis TaxID=1176198 RepID=UPI0015920E59|nr:ABC transporter substrate-binding protein [Streptomyces harbinensis]QKV71731.1 ABC transporter substrate-binding protein [Streptomyces harbinensis]
MEPLRPSDPPRIGGHRLLGRLGEGSTGRVYLARSVGGTPLALKILHRPGRRPAAPVRPPHHPCLIPFLGGGTDLDGTWEAYPYEPGPALSEAVTGYGPLPRQTVRTLGGLLAGGLDALHAAGLAHGAPHPGNVLLAAGGPRLADTARAAPGGDRAADILTLGRTLGYAATGRSPHDPADLADVPRTLLEVLQACLDPDPRMRPTAGDLAGELGGTPATGWLPPPLAAALAERAAHRPREHPDPAPPGRRPGPRDAPRNDTPRAVPDPPPARRGLLALAGGGLLLAGAAAFGSWLLRRADGTPAAAGPAGARWTIGLHADLSGPQARQGRGQHNGITLALEELNEHGNLPFRLALAVHDDVGDPPSAARAAAELAADPAVLVVIGPTGDAVADTAARVYQDAGVPVLTLSAGDFADRADYPTVLHGRPATRATGLAIPRCLAQADPPPSRIGLVDDRGADRHSWLITRAVGSAVDRTRTALVPKVLPAGTEDFAPAAAELLGHGVDAVVYGGPADGAARLARALRDAGWAGTAYATEAALDPVFLADAREAAEGWQFVAGCTDALADPRTGGFAPVHRRRFRQDPEPYAPEGYDAARMVVTAMQRTVEEGESLSRSGVLSRLRALTYHGLTRPLAFDGAGDYAGPGPAAYRYQVQSGRFRFLGPAPGEPGGAGE